MEEKTKRIRRSKDQIVQEKIDKIQSDIANYKYKIAASEKKIEELNSSVTIKDIKDKILELDIPLDEVMKAVEKLGKK